jgi:hypothetical protein
VAGYTFLRWLRSGAAGAITGTEGAGAQATRAVFPVLLRVDGVGDVRRDVALHGPGDVVGLSPRQIVRRFPDPGSTTADASCFAHVELDDPDLPWRYTPFHERTAPDAAGTALAAQGTLTPWLALVVVEEQEGVTLGYTTGDLLPVLEIRAPAIPGLELPAHDELASWEHVQIAGDLPSTADDITALLDGEPHRTVARLVCPRLLEPRTPYVACLVPVFAAGVQTGLGEPVTATLDAPAWTAAAASVRLPVYDSFRFATGPGGDFEAMVRRLQHVHLENLVDDRGVPRVGTRPLDVSFPGFGVPDRPEPTTAPLYGALRVGDGSLPPPDEDLGDDLVAAVDVGDQVAPPVYGRWHAAAPVPGAADWPDWLARLNRDPGLRVAAGEGARIVRERQEDFMAACWEQVGAITEANERLRQAQLALYASSALHRRHVKVLGAVPALQLLAPVLSRVPSPADPDRTQWADIADTCLPILALSPHVRRLLRPRGPLVRRIERWRNRDVVQRYDLGGVIERLAGGDTLGPPPAPEPALTASLADAAALADAPSTGWPGGQPPPADVQLLAQTLSGLAARVADWPACTPLDLDAAAGAVVTAVRPETTVPRRARAQLSLPAGMWDPPERIDPILAAPRITTPMYAALAARGQDWMLPGLQHVPADSVSALAANQMFVEALLAGMNHEMARELLWRGYPTDQRGSIFRHFWDRRVAPSPPDGDITELHGWLDGDQLGTHLPGGAAPDSFVLLVRGELLRRFPRASVFLVPAELAGGETRPLPLTGNAELPAFSGWLDPDVTFLGFDVAVEDVRGDNPPTTSRPGWFVVLQEQPTQPALGVSGEAGNLGADGRYESWADLGVTDLAVIGGRSAGGEPGGAPVGYIDLAATTTPEFLARAPEGSTPWDGRSENLAAILLRRPFRFYLHGSDILPARSAPPAPAGPA